jgi:predicted Zn-dependent protease
MAPGLDASMERFEASLGEPLWVEIQSQNPPIQDEKAQQALNRLLHRLCAPNGIDTAGLHRHLVQNPEVNAFAMPGRRLVIQSGLIQKAKNPDEVAGVLAHEIAHAEQGHIRRKILKEAGLSLLMAWISGGLGGGPTGIHELARVLSSTAFDRTYEAEADRVAVRYLQTARIDPEGLAVFMDRLAVNEKENPTPPEWLSTHPASPKRAVTIRHQAAQNPNTAYQPSLNESDWQALQKATSQP